MGVVVRDRGVLDGADAGIVVGEPVDLALPVVKISTMSRCSRPPSLIPTASASTRCERRSVDLIAISAAIQPPNDRPARTTSRKSSASMRSR
jgi:hypothetical protein